MVLAPLAGVHHGLGTEVLAKSPPDGYTFLVVFDTHGVNPSLIPNMSFDTLKDLARTLEIRIEQATDVLNALNQGA